jgi:hypothetical protein
MKLTRRSALLSLSSLFVAPSLARAIGPRSEISVGLIKHGGAWDHRPEALRRMLWETGKRTAIDVARDSATVSLSEGTPEGADLFFQPLLVLTGEGAMPPLDEKSRARLARHLRFGGMLFVDAPSPTDPFAESARREIEAVLPGQTLRPLPADHVITRSFFLLDHAVGRTQDDTTLYGVELAGRTVVVMTQNDLLGAMERDRFGTWKYECTPDGESQRELAFRLGVNLLMYATCLDYKNDQVHIPFIMKKKRR